MDCLRCQWWWGMTGSSCCLKKNTYLDFITRMAKQLFVVLNFLFFKERERFLHCNCNQ